MSEWGLRVCDVHRWATNYIRHMISNYDLKKDADGHNNRRMGHGTSHTQLTFLIFIKFYFYYYAILLSSSKSNREFDLNF